MTKLVIVDAHEALREGLAALLRGRGLEVLGTAGNAAAGVDLVEHAEPDVAVVDVRLPDGSGIDLARTLVWRAPRLRVLLYTGDADPALVAQGLEAGAHGYALKAGSTDELVEAIARVAGGGRYVDPRLAPVGGAARRTATAPRLTPREREIVGLMAQGGTTDTIAAQLQLSVETVRTHVRNAIRKLRARNRVHAVAIALDRGEVALDPDPGAS
jgi:DNA-binding NarL/FixJ family response regulator